MAAAHDLYRPVGPSGVDARSNAVSRVGVGFEPANLDPLNIPLPDSAFEIAYRAGDVWDETTYRLVIQRAFGDDGMGYFSYATGFIPGGFTDPATALPVQIYLWADSPERAFAERTSAAIIVLLGFLLLMNLTAVISRKRMERKW